MSCETSDSWIKYEAFITKAWKRVYFIKNAGCLIVPRNISIDRILFNIPNSMGTLLVTN